MEKLIIDTKLKDINYDVDFNVMAKFNPNIKMELESDNNIEIYGEIFNGGYGLEYLEYRLREIGNNKDVNIIINSVGGSLFEGVAMYNRLKMHKGKVTIKVIGLAASAASIVALGGDELQIAKTATLMIHNGSVFLYANKEEMREVADQLEMFDNSIAGLYSDITGITIEEIKTMMKNETFLIGKQAVDLGFATSLIEDTKIIEEENKGEISAHKVDLIMAKAGVSRKERRELLKNIKNFKSTQDATLKTDTQNAIKSNVNLF